MPKLSVNVSDEQDAGVTAAANAAGLTKNDWILGLIKLALSASPDPDDPAQYTSRGHTIGTKLVILAGRLEYAAQRQRQQLEERLIGEHNALLHLLQVILREVVRADVSATAAAVGMLDETSAALARRRIGAEGLVAAQEMVGAVLADL